MYILTIFDIKFKTNTEKTEDILRHFGFRKIQKHTYISKLDTTELSDFKKIISQTIRQKDSLLILPVCEKCYSKKENYGREIRFEEDLYRVF